MTSDIIDKLRQCVATASHHLDRVQALVNEACAKHGVGMAYQGRMLDHARIAQSTLETARSYLVGEKGEDQI